MKTSKCKFSPYPNIFIIFTCFDTPYSVHEYFDITFTIYCQIFGRKVTCLESHGSWMWPRWSNARNIAKETFTTNNCIKVCLHYLNSLTELFLSKSVEGGNRSSHSETFGWCLLLWNIFHFHIPFLVSILVKLQVLDFLETLYLPWWWVNATLEFGHKGLLLKLD